MAGKSFGIAQDADSKYRQKLLGVCYTPLELKSRLETTRQKTKAMMQFSQTRNISLVP
jgi:hypothetical protein